MSTIYALSTVFGKSGVAVFRISGDRAKDTLDLFKIKTKIAPRVATFAQIFDGTILIDEVIALYFPMPHSYTGENVCEIHCHGSIAVIKYITSKLSTIFRLAEQGEFTKRAFLNGKFDLTKAEGIVDLIEAETTEQIKQTSRQMLGDLNKEYEDLRNKIIEILSYLEAYIDFPDEEIPTEILKQIQNSVYSTIATIEKYLADGRIGEKIRKGFQISIIGPPNSGKSTLFNYFAKRRLAIVTDIPGTTRDALELKFDIKGYPVVIADTAGIRKTFDLIEIEGIKRAKMIAESSDITLVMVDINSLKTQNVKDFALGENVMYIASKADEKQTEIELNGINFLPISVHEKYNLKVLEEKVYDILSNQNRESYIITHQRHRKALENTVYYMRQFNSNNPIELAAEDLRSAASYIGSITGTIIVDDVLDKIFSSFCIGK